MKKFKDRVHVSRIHLPKRERLQEYIDGIYASGWLTNNGPLVQELERRLEVYFGVRNLLLVSSGTTGLQLAIKALDLQGDTITTPFSFISTASSLVTSNLKPVFVDIDPETYNINPDLIQSAVSKETSAIMPVHVFGNPCDIEKIDEIATTNNLKVIYDASHTFGTVYKDKPILSYGDISVISFHATKIYHTIEGGAIVVKDDETYERAKILRNYGIDGPDSIACAGINAKMNEFEAAMGLCNLEEVDLILANRKESFELYHRRLEGHIQLQKWNHRGTQCFSYMPALFRTHEEMDRIRNRLYELNIFPRQYFSPSLDRVNLGLGDQPVMVNSCDVADRILVLPLHSNAENTVCDVILETLNA